MITAIDTNVLLDIFEPGTPYEAASERAVADAAADGTVIISEVVYAETGAVFTDDRDLLDELLADLGIEVVGLGRDAAYAAGLIFASYRKAGGPRHHILADFLIAAHAGQHADRLLTRDRGFYRAYFPDLRLMAPA